MATEVPSALTRWPKYPDLRAENLRDARLYADRADMIAALPVPRGGKVAEIGVWRAAFSKVLAAQLQPRQFFAFDIFTGHTIPEWNGLTGTQLFEGLTHRQYYEREMAPFLGITTVVEGPSQQTLPKYTDHSFDLVYIDGAHDYESVKADAALAVQMVKDNGFLVFNDYLLQDLNNAAYGIVPVVNDLAVNHGWYVVGFAINHGLYADIAIQRARPQRSATTAASAQPSQAQSPGNADSGSPLAKPFRALTRMFGGWQGDARVSEKNHYRDQGYHVFRGALPLDLVNAVADRAREFVGYGGKVIRQDGSFRDHDFFPDTQLIRNSPANMHLPLPGEQAPLSAALRELVSSKALAECLKKLDGALHYNIHQTVLFYAAQTTEMHIDSWSVDTAPHGFSHTLWIPLQDIDPNSGSTAVVPWPLGKVVTEKDLGLPEAGTHRERYDRYHGALKELILSERPEIVATFLRRGDFVVWSSLTPHLSLMSNPFPRERMSLQVLVVPAHQRRGTFVNQPTEWFADRTIRINDAFSFYVPQNVSDEYGIRPD